MKNPLLRRMGERRFPWLILLVLGSMSFPLTLLFRWLATLRLAPPPPPCYGFGWACDYDPSRTGGVVGLAWLGLVAGAAVVLGITELRWREATITKSLLLMAFAVLVVASALVMTVTWLTDVF